MFSRPIPEGGVRDEAKSQEINYRLKSFKYSSHYWILKFLEDFPRPLKILDVGTADGYLGAVLRQQGHHVVGVEKDEILGKGAQPYYAKFYLADLETFDFPFRAEFDFIIFADVLEHLREPEVVLGRSLPCLNSTGQVIVSVPNIAHLLIRIMLLFGKFDYQDRGILDRTHLRFYTLSSFNALLQNAACRIVDVVPTPLPVQLVLPWTQSPLVAPIHEIHFAMVRLWKTLLAYQFVARALPYPDRNGLRDS
jgi:SAM-dependent methyltransferase